MAKLKIGLGELIEKLVGEVDTIECQDIPQGEKTRKFKAAASKLKTTLYLDKRRYRGDGEKNRLSLNTVNNYMTRIRKQFDDRLHHSFPTKTERLADRYPIYASELREWLELPAADIRQRYSQLCEQLKDIPTVAEMVSDIKRGPAGQKKLERLAVKYPQWAVYLHPLAGNGWKEAEKEMYAAFQQGSRLLDDLGHLKINHEILYHLQLPASERASIRKRWDSVLSDKKRNVVMLDYPSYMQSVTNILHAPYAPEHIGQKQQMAPMAFALAAVSGRRMIEIVANGEFEVAGRYEVLFRGQAKKRSEADDDVVRRIYTLCDARLFVERLYALRSCPAASSFAEEKATEDTDDASYRAANIRIVSGLAKSFNEFAKNFFKDEARVFKDTRAIYARIVYEMWFSTDPRWKAKDEDVFFSEILGHDDEGTQLHYKQFKLQNFSRSWRPEVGVENTRLAALQALDHEMPGFAKGDAGVRIHEETKRLVEESADVIINTNVLRKAGFNPTLVRRYLDFTSDALGQKVGGNGWLQADDSDRPPIILPFDDDQDEELDDVEIVDDESPENEKQTEHKERPVFKAPKQTTAGKWAVEFSYQGKQYFWTGEAESIRAAMEAAWLNYFQ
jgi:hypothetical protein